MPRGEAALEALEPALKDALSSTCVVIPAHNEAAVIGEVLDGLQSLPCRVVVVDDGSLDDTSAVCASHPVDLLRHGVNLGQGAALQTGITYALTLAGVRYIVTFDADGQHGTDSIVGLVGALVAGQFDVALGTRFARAADARQIPRSRRALLKCAVAFTRLTAGLPITDTHNGLRALTAEAASRLDIRHCGMAHASEILTTVRRERLRWCEVPVTISYSEYSRDKGQRGGAAMDIVWDLVMGRIR